MQAHAIAGIHLLIDDGYNNGEGIVSFAEVLPNGGQNIYRDLTPVTANGTLMDDVIAPLREKMADMKDVYGLTMNVLVDNAGVLMSDYLGAPVSPDRLEMKYAVGASELLDPRDPETLDQFHAYSDIAARVRDIAEEAESVRNWLSSAEIKFSVAPQNRIQGGPMPSGCKR